MDKIVGIGNALVDVLVQLPNDVLLKELNLPKGGMTLIEDETQPLISAAMAPYSPRKATGGSAGNMALALAGLKSDVGFIGKVGDDAFGQFFRQNCLDRGISACLISSNRHTGVANTFITPDGERTFATCLGAAATMEAGEITSSMFQGYEILHIEGYLVQNHDLIETVCKVAKAEGLCLSLDLASYNVIANDLSFFQYLVREYIDIVFANEEESAAFTNGKSPEMALSEIASMVDVAVVKLGARGASAMRGDETVIVPANKVDVVDTTAAGDFFAAGFLYSLVKGGSLHQCLSTGSLLSEHIIQVVGTHLDEEIWQNIRLKLSGCFGV